ncbi:hypothetical protein [Actinoplanes sp. NPDC049265]|uniref:hypothetical protein n=1 Tax=Actinoplanes sp. NPDC049265 TaxID=3363902 RepID=UPI003713721E
MFAPGGAVRVDVSALGHLTLLDKGGQGTVYATSVDGSRVYKEYSAPVLTTVDDGALTAMARLPGGLTPADARSLTERTAWPGTVVTRNGKVSGFLMPRAPQRFYVPMTMPTGTRTKLALTQLLLNGDDFARRTGLTTSDAFRLEFLYDVAETLEFLHRNDIAVGDLSPKNLCFSFAARPRCYFIDCDAMRVRGASVLDQVETPDWAVPGGEQRATTTTDEYKLALLVIRMFAGEQNATDPAVLDRVTPALRRLAERGLSGDASRRPDPAEWKRTLAMAMRGGTTPAPVPAQSRPGRAANVPPWNRPTGSPNVPPWNQPTGSVTVPSWNRATGSATVPPWNQPTGSATVPPWNQATGTARVQRPAFVPVQPPGPPAAFVPVGAGRRFRAGTIAKLAVVVAVLAYGLPQAGDWLRTATENWRPDRPTPAEQARSMADLLADSGNDRKKVIAAIEDIMDCRRLTQAATTLDDAASSRTALRDRAGALPTGELARGAELKTELTAALDWSRAADQAYAGWARNMARADCGSSARRGVDRARGDAQSKQATAAKKRFVALWNPIAAQYGHEQLSYVRV